MRWLWESCNLISEEASLFRVCTQTQTATHGFMLIVWICPLPVTMLYPTQPHRGTVAHAVFRTSLPAYLILFRVIQATPQLLLVIHSTTWSDVPIHTATPLLTSSPSKPAATLPANSIRILILNFFILPPRRNSSVMHLTLVILSCTGLRDMAEAFLVQFRDSLLDGATSTVRTGRRPWLGTNWLYEGCSTSSRTRVVFYTTTNKWKLG